MTGQASTIALLRCCLPSTTATLAGRPNGSSVLRRVGATCRPVVTSSSLFAKRPWLAASTTVERCFSSSFMVSFVDSEGGNEKTVEAQSGRTILEVAHEHDIDIEGACGGECACSTCHVIFDQDAYDKIEKPDEDEEDMLDLAAHVTDTSRLGCQVKLLKERDAGMKIHLPAGVGNLLA